MSGILHLWRPYVPRRRRAWSGRCTSVDRPVVRCLLLPYDPEAWDRFYVPVCSVVRIRSVDGGRYRTRRQRIHSQYETNEQALSPRVDPGLYRKPGDWTRGDRRDADPAGVLYGLLGKPRRMGAAACGACVL